jgi:hypothetical protein
VVLFAPVPTRAGSASEKLRWRATNCDAPGKSVEKRGRASRPKQQQGQWYLLSKCCFDFLFENRSAPAAYL